MATARIKMSGRSSRKATGGKSALEAEFLRVWRLYAPAGRYGDPRPQFRFHPIRQWRLDFAWPAWSVGIEIHGGQFLQTKIDPETGRPKKGGHNTVEGMQRDCEKTRDAILEGWLLLPFTTRDVEQNPCGIADDVIAALELVNRRRAAMVRKP